MADPLLTYLADHLAGSVHAIELLKNLADHYKNHELGKFAHRLLNQIESDQQTLEKLAKQLGGGSSTIKDAGAWASEKFSRLKLDLGDKDGLGTFEALEHLALGILGKASLWRALAVAAVAQKKLQGPNYDDLLRRAGDQFALVEEKRLELAGEIFRPA
jgi:hypothetical protein